MQLADKKELPKEFEGEQDKGGPRNFSKKVSAYCNAPQGVSRGALGWAVIQKDQIPRSKLMDSNWSHMLEAYAHLYDLLTQITTDGTLLTVENCDGQGSEALRRLTQRDDPTSAQASFDRMVQFLSTARSKNIKEFANNVEKWQRDMMTLENRDGTKLDDKGNTAIVINMIP